MAIIAYLDPGTGAMIIQAVIAGIVGVGFAVRLFWANIKSFCSKLLGKKVKSCEQSCSCDNSDASGNDDAK